MIERPEHVDNSARYFGWALITVGVLIVLLAGSCTLIYGEWWLVYSNFDLEIVFITALLGGVPLLVGFLLIRSGRKKLRRSRIKSDPPDDQA